MDSRSELAGLSFEMTSIKDVVIKSNYLLLMNEGFRVYLYEIECEKCRHGPMQDDQGAAAGSSFPGMTASPIRILLGEFIRSDLWAADAK